MVGNTELVIYFWGSTPYLDSDWFDPAKSEFVEWPANGGAEVAGSREIFAHGDIEGTIFLDIRQIVIPGSPIIEYGAIRAQPARIAVDVGGREIEAKFTQWRYDQDVTIFWLQRSGEPLPDNTPSGEGVWLPLPPENYPLVVVYDDAAAVLDSVRIRPPAVEQKGP